MVSFNSLKLNTGKLKIILIIINMASKLTSDTCSHKGDSSDARINTTRTEHL